MAVRVVDQPIKHFQGETLTVPASNGTRSAYNVLAGEFSEILIEPVAAMRLQLVPKITYILLYDDSAKVWRNALVEQPHLLNRQQALGSSVLGGMAVADYLYLGLAGPIGGVIYDGTTTFNATASTLTAQYSRGAGNSWQTLTISSDGSASGGATFGQDGLIVFTDPGKDVRGEDLWSSVPLSSMENMPLNTPNHPAHWLRFDVSAALDAGTTLTNLTAVGRTAPGTDSTTALTGGAWLKATTEYTMDIPDDIGSLEIIAQTTSATTARVSWVKR